MVFGRKKINCYLAKAAASILTAVSIAAVPFPSVSVYAQDVAAEQQETEIGIGALDPGEPRRGVNWSWDGADTLSLYGVDMTGTGDERLFDYTGSGEIQVEVSGYNRIDNFYCMCSGETVAISGAGTLDATEMSNVWVNSNVTVSDVYIKASGPSESFLVNESKLTVMSGYIDAPEMKLSCVITQAGGNICISGGYLNAGQVLMNPTKGVINVGGGFLQLSSLWNGTVNYQNCVIKLGRVTGTNHVFNLLEDNAVLYIGNGNTLGVKITVNGEPNSCTNFNDGARVWCHQYVKENSSGRIDPLPDYYGLYYSGKQSFDMNSGSMSGGNYFSTTGKLTVKGFSDKTTFVGSCESGANVTPNQNDSTIIAEKGVLTIEGNAAGKNIGIIGTDGVKLSASSAVDNVIAISSSDDKYALECKDGVTLSGHITAHHSGNSLGLYLDSYGLTISGEVSAYSANSSAISFPFTVSEDAGLTLGENAEISACAPNAPENKVIVEDGGEVNGSTFGDKVFYAGNLSEQMRVRGTLRIPDKDYDRFGYDRVHIGSELFFDFDHGYDYRYASASEGIEAGYTANDLSIEYKGFNGSAVAGLCLVSSREIDMDKINVSVKNSADTDITEDKFTISYSYNAYDKDDMSRDVTVNLQLKPDETLDVGDIYTVTAEYEGLTVEEELKVTAYNTTLNFCLDQDYFNAHLDEQWNCETKFLGIDKISKGSTWEWYGTATDDYKAHTLVLNGFDLYTTGKTLVIPLDTTIILRGENKLRSDTAVITVQSHDPGSISIIGEEGSSIDLTAGKLSPGNFTSGAIDLFIYSSLYLKDCNMNITILDPGSSGSGINLKTFTAENSTLNVSAENRMYAGVYAADKFTLIGSNSFSFDNADAAIRGGGMEPNGRSVLATELENIIDVDLDSFNQKVKKGDYIEWIFPNDPENTITLKTQGIAQKEPKILLGNEDGEIVPGAAEDITLDLNECFDGGTGRYSIQLAPGAELPDWVVFDQAAGTLTVTNVPDEFIDASTVDILVNDAAEELRESEDVKATVNIGAVVPKCTLNIINNDSEHCLPHIDDQYYPNYPRGAEALIKFKTDVENGWFVKTVTLNGVEITPDEDGMYRFKVEQDSELVVETEQRIRTLTLTSNGNGTVTPNTAEYVEGSEVTLTVTPDEGYQVKSVTLNGTAVELINGKYTFTITQNSVFDVEFEEIPAGYKMLTINCGEGGKVTPGTTSYAEGTEVTLTVTPDTGYQVKSVTLNGTAVELTNGKYTFTITQDSVFAAEFEKIPAGNVILTVNCGGGGKVTPRTASYAEGTEVTLTVTPDEGYQVKSVTLNGTAVELINGMYTFTITQDSVFAAEFEKIPGSNVILTVNCGEGGKVTPGTASYAEGTEVTLTVTPDTGYRVKSVTLNGTAVELTNGKYTFTVTADCVFTAEFSKKSSGGSTGGSSGVYIRPGRTETTEKNPMLNGSEKSWPEIASDLGKLVEDSSVQIDLNSETVIPTEVIRSIMEKKLRAEFIVDSVKSWIVSGEKLNAASSADLSSFPGNADRSALRGIIGADLRVTGTSVPADLKLSFRREFAGCFANVYKLVDKKLVFQGCTKIAEDGSAVISGANAGGEYVVMVCEFSDVSGDADNNGILNALDAAALLKYIVGISENANTLMCDFNGDGAVNALDAAAILKEIVGIS